MQQPRTLKISEIFPSLQGEGLRQGEPTLFIRFSGCNLRCRFCDTKYAWSEGKELSVEEIFQKIESINKRLPTRWICFTGGEPLLQDIKKLALRLKNQGFKIQVETNATLYQNLPVDWYSISPKPEQYFYHPQYLLKAKEVKVIIVKDLRMEVIRRLRKEFPDKTPLLLQPQGNRKWSIRLGLKILKKSAEEGLENIRLSLQLHRMVGIR